MDWQTQQQLIYKQQQAEKAQAKQLAAEQERLKIKTQFEQQRQREAEQVAIRNRQIEEQCLKEMEQQTAAMQRIKEGLERANREAQARLDEARAITKQLEMQATRVWISSDGKEFRSPLEMMFWNEWIKESTRQEEIPLIPQHRIGRYRVDFAHIATKTIIEIDGRMFHTNRFVFTSDRVRQRSLEKQGWRFIRFSGDEVTHGIEGVVTAAYEFINDHTSPQGAGTQGQPSL